MATTVNELAHVAPTLTFLLMAKGSASFRSMDNQLEPLCLLPTSTAQISFRSHRLNSTSRSSRTGLRTADAWCLHSMGTNLFLGYRQTSPQLAPTEETSVC